MIIYYAIGGGLGHLTRARRMLESLAIDATIVTASAYAHDSRVTDGMRVIEVPGHLEHEIDAHREWLRGLGAQRLIADTFPGGIQGELCGLDVPMDYVARLLRWDEYRRAVPGELPSFGTAWVVEELSREHDAFVRSHCKTILRAEGRGQRAEETRRNFCPLPSALCPPRSFWLIVHSGPEDEVSELVAYTTELLAMTNERPERVLVATQCDIELPEHFERIDAYPADALYPHAARIISAAGYNVMLETAAWSYKHDVIPFARRFDDQFERAARRRLAT